MGGYDYIVQRQVKWAHSRGVQLVGSRGPRGKPVYTTELDRNLYAPLLPEVYRQFEVGDGVELPRKGYPFPSKMQALHSSSALAVNVFQYWEACRDVPAIAATSGLCQQDTAAPTRISFERKYVVSPRYRKAPNIDVVLHDEGDNPPQHYAIESKFSEAYGNRRHTGLKPAYLRLEGVWEGLPNLKRLAETITPDDHNYAHLHPAQLIKHILGLRQKCESSSGFKLLYLWYDVPGSEGDVHRSEVVRFTEIAAADGICFQSLTYQELIGRLADRYRSAHADYIQYITERYL